MGPEFIDWIVNIDDIIQSFFNHFISGAFTPMTWEILFAEGILPEDVCAGIYDSCRYK
jgi:hypothetical protein